MLRYDQFKKIWGKNIPTFKGLKTLFGMSFIFDNIYQMKIDIPKVILTYVVMPLGGGGAWGAPPPHKKLPKGKPWGGCGNLAGHSIEKPGGQG